MTMQVDAAAPWETALSWERDILGISNLAGVCTKLWVSGHLNAEGALYGIPEA